MKKTTMLLLALAVALAFLLPSMSVFATERAEVKVKNSSDFRSVSLAEGKQTCFEKLSTAKDDGGFSSFGSAGELTDEQKAEIAEKWAEFTEDGGFSSFSDIWGKFGSAGELTDGQKAEIAEKWAEFTENGDFSGIWSQFRNAGELTGNQKPQMFKNWTEITKSNGFNSFHEVRGNFGPWGK